VCSNWDLKIYRAGILFSKMDVPKFDIHYVKLKPVNLDALEKGVAYSEDDIAHGYKPFRIENLQLYNPVYPNFFELSPSNYNRIGLNHKHHVQSLSDVVDIETNVTVPRNVFVKFAPLLDPIKYMTGKYAKSSEFLANLPTHSSETSSTKTCLPKLKDSNNSSYVDNFFNYLSTQLLHHHNIPHCVEYYGSYLGVQEKYKMNVTDDLEYLSESHHFVENYNKLYTATHPYMNEFVKNTSSSRANKNKLTISSVDDVLLLDSIDDLGDVSLRNALEVDDVNLVYEKDSEKTEDSSESNVGSESEADDSESRSRSHSESDSDSESDSGSDSDSESDSGSNSGSDSGSDSDSESGSDSGSACSEEEWATDSSRSCSTEDEIAQYAYINNFPVQMICLEKCDGSLDDLFVHRKIETEEGIAMLFQIIMTLLIYQKAFRFTHNDLHTNNIMYNQTDIPYLYYRYKKQVYRVPTYGKIYKIIDFGRAIYKFKGQLFCSDSFASGGDASTQYNSEPYMDENKPRLDPNPSFDLCRLGCSIYDFFSDQDKDDEFKDIITTWCLDDQDRNVLYKKNGNERYPGFKLYKMIARTVHRHTPEQQLEQLCFKKFRLLSDIQGEPIMDIDEIPVYV